MKKIAKKEKKIKEIRVKKYISPKIRESEVKPNFFLSNVSILDSFNIVGNVLAQYSSYGESGYDGYTGGNDGTGGYMNDT